MSKVKFGTGGFRGIIGDDFTKENVQKICQAICNISQRNNYKKSICIGYDNRFASENFAKWCAEVFAGNGFLVELFSCATTTPVVMYASKKNCNEFGIMITASHNFYIYNGVKVFTKQGKDASKEETDEIEAEMDKIETVVVADKTQENNITYVDYVNDYLNYLIKNQGLENSGNGLRVVFDAKFGSSVEEIKSLAEKIGLLNYKILNNRRDAFFDFKLPAPNFDNVEQLKEEVKKEKADIGFALDADGDRLAVIDENGNYIDNNYILAMVYYFFVKYENMQGGSVKNCCTSNLLDVATKKLGYTCYEVPVGFKWVSGKLIETKSLVGGESSGGLAVDNHIWGKDSLLAIGLILKMLYRLKKPFSKILSEVLHFANDYNKQTYDRAYKYSLSQEKEIKEKIFNGSNYPIDSDEILNITKTDYLKINYKNGDWLNIRFSGTEPVLRIFVECENKEVANKIFATWEKFLNLI